MKKDSLDKQISKLMWLEQERRIEEIHDTMMEKRPDLMDHPLKLAEMVELTKNFRGTGSYLPDGRIYLLQPIPVANGYHTFIFGEHGPAYVHKNVLQILDILVKHTTMLTSFDDMNKVMRLALANDSQLLPFAHTDFSLLPLGTASHLTTPWVNPVHIDEIVTENSQHSIHYSFGFSAETSVDETALEKRFKQAVIAQAIYKREKRLGKLEAAGLLQAFLALPPTPLINKWIGEMTMELPCKLGDLTIFEKKVLLNDFWDADEEVDVYLGLKKKTKEISLIKEEDKKTKEINLIQDKDEKGETK